MINSFHMNSWLYLLTIPICALGFYLYEFIYEIMNADYTFNIITLLVILILLFNLYLSNLIGLLDLITLMLMFLFILNPVVHFPMWLNILLIPIATTLSFIYRK